jgi:hypothetical protein
LAGLKYFTFQAFFPSKPDDFTVLLFPPAGKRRGAAGAIEFVNDSGCWRKRYGRKQLSKQ